MSTHLVWEYPSIAAGDIYLPQYITPTYLSTIPLLSYSSNLLAPSRGLSLEGVS
jgi:hypothetical protein